MIKNNCFETKMNLINIEKGIRTQLRVYINHNKLKTEVEFYHVKLLFYNS